MIKLRQIDTKTQYGLIRKGSRQGNMHKGESLNKNKPYNAGGSFNIQNNYNQKPLKGATKSQISFKGFEVNTVKNLFKPTVKKIPSKLTQKVFNSLKQISDVQVENYNQIRENYVNLIKTNDKIRKKLGFSDKVAHTISADNLYYIPQKKVLNKFIEQLFSPVTALYSRVEKVFIPKEKLEQINKNKKILKDFASLEGLIKSHEIWENGYRKISGNPKWTKDSEFLIPDDILAGKISRRRKKFVDPEKGKFSMTSLMLGNRLISGIVYSYFLGTDAYNTTMRYSNNKQEAANQRNSRIAQEFSRIGMNMYIQNLLYGTFETAVNRSLPTALFVSGSTAAFSEILGRKLVGKPIMPSDKETLDRLEKEMQEKKGVLPAIGRLLTNVKKKQPKSVDMKLPAIELPQNLQQNKPNSSLFRAFSDSNKREVAFKGSVTKLVKNYYEVEKFIDKKDIQTVLASLKQADEKEYKSIKSIIQKALNSSSSFNKIKKDVITNSPHKKELFDDVENVLEMGDFSALPMGKKKTAWGQLTKSFLVPVDFVKNTITGSISGIKNLYRKVTGTTTAYKINQLEKLYKSENPKDIAKVAAFNEYYASRLNLKAWKISPLSESEKKIRIFEEFSANRSKDAEDISGAKNIILWLGEQLKKEKIVVQADGKLQPQEVKKVQNIMQKAVMVADGAKHVEYDGNTISQTNINLSRAITTLFLVTDAYNLTMQYSNDNKKDANKSAKNRAAQEISRISVSAYIMAFVHNLLGKFFNSSLAGAFTLTALTSSINDSLSRKVVGVPLTPKSKEELQEIDKKNLKSPNPVKKALAYSIGKKSALPQPAAKVDNSKFYDKLFLIQPAIK